MQLLSLLNDTIWNVISQMLCCLVLNKYSCLSLMAKLSEPFLRTGVVRACTANQFLGMPQLHKTTTQKNIVPALRVLWGLQNLPTGQTFRSGVKETWLTKCYSLICLRSQYKKKKKNYNDHSFGRTRATSSKSIPVCLRKVQIFINCSVFYCRKYIIHTMV